MFSFFFLFWEWGERDSLHVNLIVHNPGTVSVFYVGNFLPYHTPGASFSFLPFWSQSALGRHLGEILRMDVFCLLLRNLLSPHLQQMKVGINFSGVLVETRERDCKHDTHLKSVCDVHSAGRCFKKGRERERQWTRKKRFSGVDFLCILRR